VAPIDGYDDGSRLPDNTDGNDSARVSFEGLISVAAERERRGRGARGRPFARQREEGET